MSSERADVMDTVTRDALLDKYSLLRNKFVAREERQRIIAATVQEILALAAAGNRERLCEIGSAFEPMVSAGTLHQQICGELAVELGLQSKLNLHPALTEHLVPNLIKALTQLVRIGATPTRDNSIEGLGALLQFDEHPEQTFPRKPPRLEHDFEEGDPNLDALFFERLDRWHWMALAVARHRLCLGIYVEELKAPLVYNDSENFIALLYRRADLVRTLPAIVRQAQGETLPFDPFELLCRGTTVTNKDEDSEVAIAFARYQEIVFRTIAVMVKRIFDAKPYDPAAAAAAIATFDKPVAAAVAALPPTLYGPAGDCNARVRATVAIVRTAIRLIEKGDAPHANDALRPLFRGLSKISPWLNLGIAEGCYRLLPSLLAESRHNGLTKPALSAMLTHLSTRYDPSDFADTHRRLLANGCLRRILLLALKDEERAKIERKARALLAYPTSQRILDLFQRPDAVFDDAAGIAEIVIAGTAAEQDSLRRAVVQFGKWKELSMRDQLLLTRILAAQLRAARDAQQISRDDFLRRVYGNVPSKAFDDDRQAEQSERLDLIWKLLSTAPPEAAHAADADLPAFLEHIGGGRFGEADVNLPGNVLAMVSENVKGRIADAIGREIDMHARRAQSKPGFDFGTVLYQVMLRGAGVIIFDALLRRLDGGQHRAMAVAMRNYAALERHPALGTVIPDALLLELSAPGSRTLCELARALRRYRRLMGESPRIWKCLELGSLERLLLSFDDLAHSVGGDRFRGLSLSFVCIAPLADFKNAVSLYLHLPVGEFDKRNAALTKAADAVARMQEKLKSKAGGLRDPEGNLLLKLLRHLSRQLEATKKRFCDQPKEFREKSQPDEFWDRYVLEKKQPGQLYPPSFPGQSARFERFFVKWTSSEFRIDSLTRALKERWSMAFRIAYAVMTDVGRIATMMIIPFALAILFHWFGLHEVEGVGFFVMSIVAFLGAAILWLWPRSKKKRESYRYDCLYPRMAALIAAPMLLTTELDHSYFFPLHAPDLPLTILLVLGFVATRLMIGRAMGDPVDDKRTARRVMAVAMSHSFAMAVILSMIFGSHVRHLVNNVEHALHDEHAFLGILPRAVRFDLPQILSIYDRELPFGEAWFQCGYYPTVVLVWTALGLLVGVTVEGFFKREAEHE